MGLGDVNAINLENGHQQPCTWTQSNTGKLYRAGSSFGSDSAKGSWAKQGMVLGVLIDRGQKKMWFFRDGQLDGMIDSLPAATTQLCLIADFGKCCRFSSCEGLLVGR